MSILAVLLVILLAPTFGLACSNIRTSEHLNLGADPVVLAEFSCHVLEAEHWQETGAHHQLTSSTYRAPLIVHMAGDGALQHTLNHQDCPACSRARFEAMRNSDFGTLPFKEAAEIWLASRVRIASRTKLDYQNNLKRLVPFFGELRVKDIHLGHITEYRKVRQEKAGPSRINHEMSTVQQILGRAGLWQGSEIASWYEPLALPKNSPGIALEPDQEERLFRTAAKSKRWLVAYCCSLITANTTAGPEEVRCLRLGDVSLSDRVIYVREGAKNGYRVRTLPLNDAAFWAVTTLVHRAHDKGATATEHYLLPHRAPAAGLSCDPTRPMDSWKKAWYSLRTAAGLPHVRRYDLRHHAITRLAENPEVSETTLRELAGHVSRKMLERYSHIRIEAKRAAVQALSKRAWKTRRNCKSLKISRRFLERERIFPLTRSYYMLCSAQMAKRKRPKDAAQVRTWRARPEDEQLLQKIMEKTGIANTTDVVRVALRRLAEFEKVA